MRFRKKPWAAEEMATNKAIISEPKEYKGKWREVFENDNPIHIEIGCGKGQFISKMSVANPNINYIGIEKESAVIVAALKKSRLLETGNNLRFFVLDVAEILDVFETGEVQRIYTNFADPWHRKKKWAKRRLTHKNFLRLYEQLFGANGGEVFMKTSPPFAPKSCSYKRKKFL